MARSTFVYVTYIRTTPEKLWSALTDVEFMKQYWFGMHCECQWTAGSPWKLVSGDGVTNSRHIETQLSGAFARYFCESVNMPVASTGTAELPMLCARVSILLNPYVA